jgi:hypothetical protein
MGDGQPVKGTSNSAWYDAPLGESRLCNTVADVTQDRTSSGRTASTACRIALV